MNTHPYRPLIIILYIALAGIFGGTMWFVQSRAALTERRSKAAASISCDYTIDIPEPTNLPAPSIETTPIPTVVPELVASVCHQDIDVVFAIDASGSMGQLDSGKKKIEWAKDAAKAFVTAMEKNSAIQTRISIVPFSGQAVILISSSTEYQSIINSIQSLNQLTGGSCLQCGLRVGSEQLTLSARTKAVILLSDGLANRNLQGSQSNAKQLSIVEANLGRAKGIEYYAMGFGSKPKQVDETTLMAIAGPESNYLYQPDVTQWTNSFLSLIPKICQ